MARLTPRRRLRKILTRRHGKRVASLLLTLAALCGSPGLGQHVYDAIDAAGGNRVTVWEDGSFKAGPATGCLPGAWCN